MPLTLQQIEENVVWEAGRQHLTESQEADLRTKVRRGHHEHTGKPGAVKNVTQLKRKLREEALDLMGYPSLADRETRLKDQVLEEASLVGAYLLQIIDEDLESQAL
jgi:hypothetical protein